MDWTKIKSIFILTFLVLDIYLFYQFLQIRDANKYEFITEASFEDKLKADGITYITLPKAAAKDQYISAAPKGFTNKDLEQLKNQRATIVNDTVIQSIFEKPVPLGKKFDSTELSSFIKDHVLFGDQYVLWGKNDKKNTITFYQQYHQKPFYRNLSGMIILHLNKKNQIVSYQQTYLEDIDKLTAKEEILPPLKAIETLHQRGMLKQDSRITKAELGYSTLVQLTASQVLAPTWHIVVDDKTNLYVNAFEGQIIDFSNDENKVVE